MNMRKCCASLLASAVLLISCSAHAANSNFGKRADTLLKVHLARGDFSGVVLVAHNGRPILRRAYGLANREWMVRNTVDTEFRIGSVTKQFTAAAIFQLIEAGKVRLDDPIKSYVEGLPPAWNVVTIRQLLNHTSGIPDFVQFNGFIRGPARLDLTPDQILALVRDEPLEFTPGSRFKYSNTGYALLGMVIERISGQSYADYMQHNIFRPLALTHTAFDDPSEILPRRASGYWLSDGVWKNARAFTPQAAYAGGGLRSNADDLLRFEEALHAGKLVSPASVRAMFTDYGHNYGFGSFVEKREGHRLWDHGGNLPGFSSAFEQYPDDGLVVIVLTNVEGEGSERLAKELAGIYFGWPGSTKS